MRERRVSVNWGIMSESEKVGGGESFEAARYAQGTNSRDTNQLEQKFLHS